MTSHQESWSTAARDAFSWPGTKNSANDEQKAVEWGHGNPIYGMRVGSYKSYIILHLEKYHIELSCLLYSTISFYKTRSPKKTQDTLSNVSVLQHQAVPNIGKKSIPVWSGRIINSSSVRTLADATQPGRNQGETREPKKGLISIFWITIP